MDRAKIELRIREIIAREQDIDIQQVKPDSQLVKLGMDSFGAVEFIFLLEEEFSIKTTNLDMKRIVTVKDIVDAVCERVFKKSE